MAQVLIVRDPDRRRRERCLSAASDGLEVPGAVEAGRLSAGPLVAAWRAGRQAAVSTAGPNDGARAGAARGGGGASGTPVAVIWGDALAAGRAERTSARELLGHADGAPCFDGFHAWMSRDELSTLRLGADPLGLFPLYWTRPRPDVLLAATSPGLLAHHPSLAARCDPRGLAGVLLTNGLVQGRTVLAGVRRLAPGHVLRWRPGEEAEEVEAYRPTPSEELCRAPKPALLHRLDETLEAVVRRHTAPHGRVGVMLSGGLDSRLLAGYADRLGTLTGAVTLGRPGDLEYRCAADVAGALDLPHHRVEHRPADLPRSARLEVRTDALSSGFSGPQGWTLALRRPDELPAALLLGHLGNAVLSLSGIRFGLDDEGRGELSARRFVDHVRRWGVPSEVLRACARPDFLEEHVEPLLASLPESMVPEARSPAHRLWLADLAHRQRLHVGSSAWRLAFAVWPLVPVTDRAVLDLMASVPVGVLHERRLHVELLIRAFPRLARQPLDRNSFDIRPPLPRTRHHVATALRQRFFESPLGRWWRRIRAERRYYYRLYDLDSAGWRAVRRAAEPGRQRLGDFFDVSRLTDTYLPPPGVSVDTGDAIIDASGRKLLLGWMLGAESGALPVGPRGSIIR